MSKPKLFFRDEMNFSMGRWLMVYVYLCVFLGLLLGASASFSGETIEYVEETFLDNITNPSDDKCSVFEPTCRDMKLWVWGLSAMVMGGMTAVVFLFVPLGFAMPFIMYLGPILPLLFIVWVMDYMFSLGYTDRLEAVVLSKLKTKYKELINWVNENG